MAKNALDILSVTDARRQIDVDDDDTSQDPVIETSVIHAVDYVHQITGIPLLDEQVTVEAVTRGSDKPLILVMRDIRSVDAVDYWTTDQAAREAPAGTIEDLETLGQIRETNTGYGPMTEIWPPEAGWPARAADMQGLQVTVTVGWDIPESGHSVVQAIILLTRLFFEQPDRLDSDFAIHALLAPHRRWNG